MGYLRFAEGFGWSLVTIQIFMLIRGIRDQVSPISLGAMVFILTFNSIIAILLTKFRRSAK